MTGSTAIVRCWAAATLAAGGSLIGRPALVGVLGGPAPPPLQLIRVLGARYVLQGAILPGNPHRPAVIGAVLVDAAHAATMVVAALTRPDYRRLALASAAVAAASAATGILARPGR